MTVWGHSLRLVAFVSLAAFLSLYAYTGDAEASLRLVAIPLAIAFAFCARAQVRIIHAHVHRESNRALRVPSVATPYNIVTTPDNARSIVLNSNGVQGTMSLEPQLSDLCVFLERCIALTSPESRTFPTVRRLTDSGIGYDVYRNNMRLLAKALVPKKSRNATPRIRNGHTLGQLLTYARGDRLLF